MEVKCPRCGKAAQFSSENPYRPFCSERCKMIDLGAWASEAYAIPVANPTEEDLERAEKELAEASKEDEEPGAPLH